jgi:hypothetical protein
LQFTALIGQTPVHESSIGNVLYGEQNNPRQIRPLHHEPRIEEQDLAADPRKHVVNVLIKELRFERQTVVQHLAKRGNVPLAVTEGDKCLTDRVFRRYAEGAKEGAIRVCIVEVGVKHKQRFAYCVDNFELQPLHSRNSWIPFEPWQPGKRCFHRE